MTPVPNTSDNVVSMERASQPDSDYAKFVDMEEYKTGVFAWSLWDTNYCWINIDPTYKCHVIDNEASTFSLN